MCGHVILTTFIKALSELKYLVRGGTGSHEARLIRPHGTFVGYIDKRYTTEVAAVQLIALFVDGTHNTIHPFFRKFLLFSNLRNHPVISPSQFLSSIFKELSW